MKSLIEHISQVKTLHSLNEFIHEKLVINKDYKSLSDDFCDEFEDDIEYILTQIDTIRTNDDIKNVLEDTYYKRNYKRKNILIVLDIIKEENLFNNKNKIFVAQGFVDVNSFYYKLFLKMSAYCKEHISDKWLCYYNYEGHNSTYVLNTYKYYIIIWGDDLQDRGFSSGHIVIQEK